MTIQEFLLIEKKPKSMQHIEEAEQNKKLSLAIYLSSFIHLDQKDDSGSPYILHSLRVMGGVSSYCLMTKQVAILHDCIEDGVNKILFKLCPMYDFQHQFRDTGFSLNGDVEAIETCFKFLSFLGFHQDVLVALRLLTKDNNVPKGDDGYYEYINKIGLNLMATRVKISDLTDNSQLSRLRGVTAKDQKRSVKYNNCYVYLKSRELQLSKICGFQ